MFHSCQSITIGAGNVKAAWIALLFCAALTYAAFERDAVDPVSRSLSGAGLALDRMGGFAQNPALASPRMLGIRWEQPYGARELTSEMAAVAFPIREWSGAATFEQTGDEAYREQRAVALANYAVQPDLRVGLAAQWSALAIQGLPDGSAATLTVGLQGRLSQDLAGAVVWRNALRAKLSRYEDRLPTLLAAGLAFAADDNTTFVLDAAQEPGWPVELRGGVQMRILKPLTLRAGARFDPAEYSTGFSLKHRSLNFHYALSWHRELGATHGLGLDFQWR